MPQKTGEQDQRTHGQQVESFMDSIAKILARTWLRDQRQQNSFGFPQSDIFSREKRE